jgi:hypothetical protein
VLPAPYVPPNTPSGGKPPKKTGGKPPKKTGGKPPKKTGGKPPKKTGGKPPKKTGDAAVKWSKATATWYTSYPPCCKENSNYDPKASKTECTDYNGCRWAGQFSGVEGKLSVEEVKKRNIVSFFDAKNQKSCRTGTCAWWDANVKNKKIILKHPTTGATLVADALDTCSDADTKNNDCTRNANKNGGILVDMETHTAGRFWGAKRPGISKIQWAWADGAATDTAGTTGDAAASAPQGGEKKKTKGEKKKSDKKKKKKSKEKKKSDKKKKENGKEKKKSDKKKKENAKEKKKRKMDKDKRKKKMSRV